MLKQLENILESRKHKNRFRKLTVMDPESTVDFSSNDFLSLGKYQPFKDSVSVKVADFCAQTSSSLGSGGSRLLDGNCALYEGLERQIAAFHGAKSGLIFNSGFDANSGFFSCLPQPQDIVIYDELIHASVHEGMRQCRAKKRVLFKHNDVEDFERVLNQYKGESGNIFVAVEAVYSMDGDTAPLRQLYDVSDRLNREILLVVDEAHATGVLGDQGRGLVCALGMEKQVFARIHTFGKALSANGAIILCHPVVRSYLINYARSFIFTTALGQVNLLIIQATYELLETQAAAHLQTQLWDNLQRFSTGLKDTGVHVYPPVPRSAIFSVFCDNPRSLAAHCQQSGLVVRPIVHPTVPKGTERVRVCIHSANTAKEVDMLVHRILEWHSQKEMRGRL
ncbi:pyridoxal phosphate-dependent transferase [Yarrowia lipolytica]|jgi:8-amino-7-oxononanoate synthase|uniref:YALI0E17545p n=2 Tax=Yarrowia lipolytica TaxID=4952 RepID=Q6C5J6_YARLI|nr:YALI0E17545p [Yarrowia lipolytica CLIB122]AOW05550.1 hypothetical protein YALI1_E20766g [Yarrowia lipolytica]KAB8282735.1 pyridoxal phosphate-dependent transferase [Yarrowia lipolytica]KAE8173777.1 pyridoxal phosphate-dependent transferase [Yarrowia lipolytica]KAJ8057042.1 pyridoxal phosphate-dependent transferase [Yarrowia lipolytica]QNP99034.1 8-amino-7-oxononanoate synthase [Yarrowia lipolytica]|eukprot:XP_504066.1 YALI0E17545p [Yarrowia lipolytica CLIB122]